MTVAFVITLF